MVSRAFAIPSWGGWGGRYVLSPTLWRDARDLDAGRRCFARVTSQDAVSARDGKTYVSDQATIWRWRTAFQHDFAARMDWTVKEFAEANHAPRGGEWHRGTAPSASMRRSASPWFSTPPAAVDPDGQRLNYRWFHYAEAGFVPGQALAKVTLAAEIRRAPRSP